MKIHSLKILPEYFQAILSGKKKFEIRKNDRDYKAGDILLLNEWNGEKFTGNTLSKKVTYILGCESGYVLDGYVVMSIEDRG